MSEARHGSVPVPGLRPLEGALEAVAMAVAPPVAMGPIVPCDLHG